MTYRELITQLLRIDDLDQTARVHMIYRNENNIATLYESVDIGHVTKTGPNHGIKFEKKDAVVHDPRITILNHRDIQAQMAFEILKDEKGI